MSARFTTDGSDALEQHLAKVCDRVRDGVRALIPDHKLEGLALAGGYGRGEGGVLDKPEGHAPYNDLEFFVFIRGSTLLNDRRYRRLLHELGEKLTPEAGIEVEFKILSLEKLSRSGPSMFYYDLLRGHRWLIGDDVLFAPCIDHLDATRIPLHEATRLLFNRCSGLLYAKERIQRDAFSDEDADFVGRNIAKAKLALGDAWLTVQGEYHWSCRERLRRLQAMNDDWSRRLAPHHAQGVEFKLHPHNARAEMKAQLVSDHAEIGALAQSLWLHLEGKRIQQTFGSPRDYARSSESLCPESSRIKNVLCNVRAFGLHGLSSSFRLRYPRERLLRALSLLLWGETDSRDSAIISQCLLCNDPGFGPSVRAYESLWHRFN